MTGGTMQTAVEIRAKLAGSDNGWTVTYADSVGSVWEQWVFRRDATTCVTCAVYHIGEGR